MADVTIAHRFQNWETSGVPLDGHRTCSPNLVLLRDRCSAEFRTRSRGCYSVRPVRGSLLIRSPHSWGAALDLDWTLLGRPALESKLLPWLVAWSEELGVQAIHDYVGCRIWRAGRTPHEHEACGAWWRAQRPDSHGMGQPWATWIHVETHPDRWGDRRTFQERGVAP